MPVALANVVRYCGQIQRSRSVANEQLSATVAEKPRDDL